MNNEAIEWWFEEHDIDHRPVPGRDEYILPDTHHLSNDTLGELSACNASIRVASVSGELIITDK